MGLSKKKKNIYIGVLAIIGCFLIMAFYNKNKKTQITWYITNIHTYGFSREEIEPYEELHSEQFDLFNKRLKELKIPAEVVFKAAPDIQDLIDGDEERLQKEIEASGKVVKEIISKDEWADIVRFSGMEYQQFLTLDSYFQSGGMAKAKESIPKPLWEVNRINGKSYQVPRGLVSARETVYVFYRPFLEKYQIDIDEADVHEMSPRQVIEWLSTFFHGESVLDNKYYITSSDNLFAQAHFQRKVKPMLEGNTIDVMLDYETGEIQDMYSNKDVLEYLDLCQWIYQNNIDAHKEQANGAVTYTPVFKMTDIPEIEELGGKNNEKNWEKVQLGDRWLDSSVGNGVLKSSQHKELAVEVLAATAYDEELSNIMIHGVPEKDYTLQDGKVVYKEDGEIANYNIGNNLIAYPTEEEILNKKEVSEQLLNQIPIIPHSNFTPVWERTMLEQTAQIAEICWETISDVLYSEIPNMEEYLNIQRQKSKEAGLGKVISELQRQVDDWIE